MGHMIGDGEELRVIRGGHISAGEWHLDPSNALFFPCADVSVSRMCALWYSFRHMSSLVCRLHPFFFLSEDSSAYGTST